MKRLRKISLGILILTIAALPVQAFSVSSPLASQVDVLNNTQLDGSGQLILKSQSNMVESMTLSPNFNTDNTMFVGTSQGAYVNYSYAADFSQNATWASDMKTLPLHAMFNSNYTDNGAVMLTDGDVAYVSYDHGNTWAKETLVNNGETVTKVFLGPAFSMHQLLYFITDSGLYSQDVGSTTSRSLVMASDSSGKVTDFAFAPFTTSDSVFFIVKGTKVMKTETMGSGWLEYDTKGNIKQLVIEDKISSPNNGNALVLSGTKNLQKAETALDFGPLNTPAGITEIYGFTRIVNSAQSYVVNTDKGFYLSYDNGNGWVKIDEGIADYSKVTNLAAVTSGGKTSIFYTLDGKIYRDDEAKGTPLLFMTGITVTTRYATSGSAVSKEIVALSGQTFDPTYNIDKATLTADADLHSQTMNFFMTADGTNWEAVTPNVQYTFTHKGNTLKWKVEMSTTDAAVTPVLKTMSVDFGFETPPATPSTQCAGFSDVLATDPTCAAVTYAKDQGIFQGYQDGSFKPDQSISRSETVKVITVGFNKTILPAPTDNLGFSDVVLSEFYMPYLATAKALGIIQGYPDGTFKPAQTVNYVELIKVFFKTSGVTLPTAVATDPWYQPYLTYAKNNSYLVYDNLDAGMKRADVATLFYQYSQK